MIEGEPVHEERKRVPNWAKNIIVSGIVIAGSIASCEVIPGARSLYIELSRRNATIPRVIEDPQDMTFGVSPHNNSLDEVDELRNVFRLNITHVNMFLHEYRDSVSMLDAWVTRACESGITPQITYGPAVPLFTIPEEVYEHQKYILMADFYSLAQQLSTYDCIVELRPYIEMNGPWFAHGSTSIKPDQYIRGWIRIWNVFDEVGADNVQFVFSPASTMNADPIELYWPGREYVDINALDIYKKYSPDIFSPLHYVFPNISAESALGPDLTKLYELGPDIPIHIAEIGIMSPEYNQQWLDDAVEYAQSQGVVVLSYFAWDKKEAAWDEDHWRIQGHAPVLAILQQHFYLPNEDQTVTQVIDDAL